MNIIERVLLSIFPGSRKPANEQIGPRKYFRSLLLHFRPRTVPESTLKFDPAEMSFYYARVVEIPTPRWTAFDVVKLGAKMPKEVPMVIQERAYTSPIWYTP